MTLYVIGFLLIFLLVLASGFPVGFGIGFVAMGTFILFSGVETGLTMAIEKAYHSLDSSILVAVPLFIFAAQLISQTGMGQRLFNAARAFLGRFQSGLGIGTIASSGLFAAMTGSSFVAASTMGLIAIPELRKAKYSDTIIAATITAGGSLGSVIPPSLMMIIYGFLTDESIARLFMAGLVPGIILIFLYSFALVLIGKKASFSDNSQVKAIDKEFSGGEVTLKDKEAAGEGIDTTMAEKMSALKDAFWGLMAPVIILGGIYLGVFTANEAAAVAVVYCIIVGFFIYRTLTIKKLFAVMMSSANVSAMVAMIIVGGAMMGHVIVLGRVPTVIVEYIIAQNLQPLVLLIVLNIILFVLGMFMEVLALIYIVVPLMFPVVMHMEWSNIWFAVILCINVNLALITPPIGGVLYVVSQIGNIPVLTVAKGAILPIVILIFLLALIIAFPPIATWLPSMM